MVSWKAIVAVLAVLLYVGFQVMQHYMSMGFYTPGSLADEALAGLVDLQPPEQPSSYDANARSGTWLVERGVEIHWDRLGDGGGRKDVAVLVLHGGPGYPMETHEIADGIVAEFEDVAVYAFHQRGCGLSSRPVDGLDDTADIYQNLLFLHQVVGIPVQLVDIERIRRILGVQKLVLVGHSFGAFLSTMYAIEFPRQTAAVVNVCPADVLVFPAPGDGLIGAAARHIQAQGDEAKLEEYYEFIQAYFNLNALMKNSEEEMRQMNLKFAGYMLPVFTDDHPELHFGEPKAEWAGGWMVTGMFIGLGSKHDYSQQVSEVECPMLVLHGELDVQDEDSSASYATSPESRLVTIPAAGHNMFLDNPAAFHDAVVAFLRSLGI
mmetsp:Transcript_820/g.2993  ORF Transcript_820/g.2993 Transcript_820/m.2993 type:complete len:378 (-) Transcript_820:26-1159(-)